jgi:hypothetical protein
MRYRMVGVIALLVLVTVGCAGNVDAPDTAPVEPDAATESFDEADAPDSVYSEACGQAVAAAAAIDDMQDTVEDLDPAIAVCADFDELVAAFEDYPAALDGVDAQTFVANRCLYSEDASVTSSQICAEVSAE